MGHWLIFQPEISFSHLRLHCLSSLTVKSVTTYIHTVLIQLRHISETDCIAAFPCWLQGVIDLMSFNLGCTISCIPPCFSWSPRVLKATWPSFHSSYSQNPLPAPYLNGLEDQLFWAEIRLLSGDVWSNLALSGAIWGCLGLMWGHLHYSCLALTGACLDPSGAVWGTLHNML